MGSRSSPEEDPAARRIRKRQEAELVRLDEEENLRVRRIMRAGRGMRAFKGSPDMRLRRGNFGSAPAATPSPGPESPPGAAPSRGGGTPQRSWRAHGVTRKSAV